MRRIRICMACLFPQCAALQSGECALHMLAADLLQLLLLAEAKNLQQVSGGFRGGDGGGGYLRRPVEDWCRNLQL
jgi:hypothetical protein